LEICRRVDKRLEQNFADESYLEIVDFFSNPRAREFLSVLSRHGFHTHAWFLPAISKRMAPD